MTDHDTDNPHVKLKAPNKCIPQTISLTQTSHIQSKHTMMIPTPVASNSPCKLTICDKTCTSHTPKYNAGLYAGREQAGTQLEINVQFTDQCCMVIHVVPIGHSIVNSQIIWSQVLRPNKLCVTNKLTSVHMPSTVQ